MRADPEYQNLLIDSIDPSPTNPRKRFEGLEDLSDSIIQKGVLQPILVRDKDGDPGRYEIVAGERRYRASKLAQVDTIPAIVREFTDEEVLDIQIIENCQREDVHPFEEAEGYALMQKVTQRTVDEIAARVGRSAAHITKRMRLGSLPPEAAKWYDAGNITLGVLQEISKLPSDTLRVKCFKDLKTSKRHDFKRGYVLKEGEVRKFVTEHYLLDLKDVLWDVDDAGLFKAAGKCTTCSKRSSSQGELFANSTTDLCLDRECLANKSKRHLARMKKQLPNAIFLPAKLAQQAVDRSWQTDYSPYDETCWNGRGYEKVSLILKGVDAKPIYGIANNRIVRFASDDQIKRALEKRRANKDHKPSKAELDMKEKAAATREQQRQRKMVVDRTIPLAMTLLKGSGLDFMDLACRKLLRECGSDAIKKLITMHPDWERVMGKHSWEAKPHLEPYKTIQKAYEQHGQPVILGLILVSEGPSNWNENGSEDGWKQPVEQLGIDLAAIKRDVRNERNAAKRKQKKIPTGKKGKK